MLEHQRELNYQNSVTEITPALIDDIAQFRDNSAAQIASEGLTEYMLQGGLILQRKEQSHSPHVETLTIVSNTETGRPTEIRYRKDFEYDEPGNYVLIILEDTVYSFENIDGVTHLKTTSMDQQWLADKPKPPVTERKDDPTDVERLKKILDADRIHDGIAELRLRKERAERRTSHDTRVASGGSKIGRLLSRVRNN